MKNNKLCVAVIGCGTIARARHIPELVENPYVGEVVLAELYENAIADLVTNYHIKRYFTGNDAWKKVVQTEDIDAVIVCTPNALHAPITVSALNAGKHVMVEKPMAISNAEAQEMCKAAYNNNKLLLVAHHRRHQNCYLIGKTILQSGLLGNITGILAQHKQPGPIEWAPNSTWFFQNPVKGGGVMMDLGIHMADVVSWYCEDEALETKAIITQKGTPYEQARCIVKMKSGCGVVIDVAWGVFAQEKRVTVYCEKGKMIVDEYAENGVVISLTSPLKTSAIFVLPAPAPNLAGNPNLGLVDHYIKCIKNGDLQRERLVEHTNALKIVLDEIN
jgi:predicted dehydrogenase